jgi:HEPN domain-containing protein
MMSDEKVKYWIESAKNDLVVAGHLTHSLTYLAEKVGLTPTAEQLELLEIITDFNLEVRYPDEKFSFYKKCTDQFSKTYMQKIEEIRKWLLQQIQ